MIVEIRYLFGIGGFIIVCCVVWDFYKIYFCVILEIMSFCYYFDDDNILFIKFVDWILVLGEFCYILFLILIDGKYFGLIEVFLNKFVWMFCNKGKWVLLLCCKYGLKLIKRVV